MLSQRVKQVLFMFATLRHILLKDIRATRASLMLMCSSTRFHGPDVMRSRSVLDRPIGSIPPECCGLESLLALWVSAVQTTVSFVVWILWCPPFCPYLLPAEDHNVLMSQHPHKEQTPHRHRHPEVHYHVVLGDPRSLGPKGVFLDSPGTATFCDVGVPVWSFPYQPLCTSNHIPYPRSHQHGPRGWWRRLSPSQQRRWAPWPVSALCELNPT